MIKKQILIFLLRWLVSSLGMWLCISLFGVLSAPADFWLFFFAGLIFALVNTVLKPLITLLALPLVIFTLGLTTVLINIGIVALTIWLLPSVEMSFWGLVFTVLIMSAINTLVNFLVPAYNKH